MTVSTEGSMKPRQNSTSFLEIADFQTLRRRQYVGILDRLDKLGLPAQRELLREAADYILLLQMKNHPPLGNTGLADFSSDTVNIP
jgi:hypothetical protein